MNRKERVRHNVKVQKLRNGLLIARKNKEKLVPERRHKEK
jgi:hypothetical protein